MKGEFAQVLEVIASDPGKKWTPDRIKEARPTLTLSCETIGHNLRRARRKGRVEVSYYISERGQRVAEYFAAADAPLLPLHLPDAPANDMDLPADKTCGDCDNFDRCKMLFQCRPSNLRCDWSPSRFTAKTEAVK